jgi:hypothetical protein
LLDGMQVVDVLPTGVADAMPHARLRRRDIGARAASVHLLMGLVVAYSRAIANAPARSSGSMNA